MLFGRKQYSYINMAMLYIKLVPGIAITKVINNLIYSLIPTLNILITAMFLDRAILVVNGTNEIREVILPLSLIIAMRLFNYYTGIITGLISVHADNKLKSIILPEIAEKKAGIKFRYFENQDNIEVMNRALDGFAGNIQGFFDRIFNIWDIAAQIIGFILILGFQLWWAPVLFVIASIPSFIISYKFGRKRYDVDKDMAKIDRRAWYITGILTGRDTIEERYMYGYTDKLNDDYMANYDISWEARKKVTRSLWVNTTTSGMLTFASGIVVVAVLLFSIITPNAGGSTMSIGLFISLIGAIFGLSQYVQETIPDYIYSLRYKFEYLKELNQTLNFAEDKDATCLPEHFDFKLESVEFKNVSFKYPDCDAYILRDLNLRLEAGKHYAIVGENGCGKTTITKILTGLYDNYEGQVYINGKELSQYNQSEIKAVFAVLYQDFSRYPLDFYNNIAIGNINDINNTENVEAAVKKIGLAGVLEKLPNGYHTNITKVKADGVDISGGEWQRTALARLLVNPAPVKILDEPASALDPVSESKLYEEFGKIIDNEQIKNKIILFISHRLGSVKLADNIIVISGGRAAEVGSFNELMLRNGIFAKMYKSQSEWYKEKKSNSGNGGDLSE